MGASLVSLMGYPSIRLSGGLTLVGRHPSCDLRLGSSRVSRAHCCVALQGSVVVVRDLASTNGTFVNGLRVDAASLSEGDELGIAHLIYRVRLGDSGVQGSTSLRAEGSREQEPGASRSDGATL